MKSSNQSLGGAARKTSGFWVAVATVALMTLVVVPAAAQGRNDILFRIEPGGLGLLSVNGTPIDVDLSGGVVALTVDDPNCVAVNENFCTYTINFMTLELGGFSFGETSVARSVLTLEEPVAVADGGDGIFVPPGTPLLLGAVIDGVSSTHGEALPTGLSLIVDRDSQQAVVSGSFQGNLHGLAIETFVVGNAESPFVNLPPVADAGPDLFAVGCGPTIGVPLGATATDPQNGEIRAVHWTENGAIVAEGLNTTANLSPGFHTLLLEVFDDFSARGTDSMTVDVTEGDFEEPVFTSVPADITTTNCGTLNIGTATASDACGSVTITNNRPTKFSPGTTLVTWTATDETGNVTTATQRVTLILGDNASCCPTGSHVIVGTSNNNVLNGTSGSDCILGLGGQDTINGFGGNDFIAGGEGNDIIDSGSGNDRVFGGTGQDRLTGNTGDDLLNGGDGDDVCGGGIGNDTLHGGQGQDQLRGEDGHDQLFGEDGDDRLEGGNGDDTLVGGGLHDTCLGGTGANTFASCQSPAPNSCVDLVRNGTETDVDCGGACSTCEVGEACIGGSDCQSTLCSGGICVEPP